MQTFKVTQKVKELTGTRKREFWLSVYDKGRAINTASYWDGGSKDNYRVYNYKTRASKTPPIGSYPMFKAEYVLEENEILIRDGISCGKPATIHIYCLEDDEQEVKNFLGVQ